LNKLELNSSIFSK